MITAGVAVLASGVGLVAASAQQGDQPDKQPSSVESFGYPGAAKVLAQRGIKLLKGDGHIMLAACGAPGLIEVRSTSVPGDKDPDPGHFCFTVTGATGWLTLNIPNAYQIKGNDHSVTATVTVKDKTSTVPVERNGWTGIGLGSGPDPATLLELRAAS
ncbi:hypothetical protein M8C13_19250 [Crossiella sp. SN42]|uniref:hypothetical protein n=1 Tax=Crossiella sp. SN42 TaxID=2944808 RepID=UPI00207C9D9F|nr:hypothetical protein [Crossiella sp. SN42]MCO1577894.1 hypothetical protein [Crossiella sp. SN42]